MNILNNKGMSTVWDVIVWAVIILVVGLVVIISFNNLFGKEVGGLGGELNWMGDYDVDSVADRFDKCVCIAGEQSNGCPSGWESTTHAQRFKQCPPDICRKLGLVEEKDIKEYCTGG